MPTQMPHICHMAKLIDVNLWGRYAKVYAIQEVTVIIIVVCRKGHRQTYNGQSTTA